jgi:cytochrome c oxidase subunit 1
MDMAQPTVFQFLGQFFSYASSVPVTVVTIFGAMSQIYRSGVKWSYVPLGFSLGLMGWVIGGFSAVVDSTIMVNIFFHNTLWVPSHFHTYFLMGFVLMLFGFIYDFLKVETEGIARLSLWSMVLGGYGFLSLFAWAGVHGVPRRYAVYSDIPLKSVAQIGESSAFIAVLFVGLVIVGILLFAVSISGGVGKKWSES